MSFEIKPNRIDSQEEIIALIEANAPTPPNATPTVRGIIYGLNSDSGQNVAYGYTSLQNNDDTQGYENTAIGYSSLQVNTTAPHNTAVGAYSLLENTTGERNTAIGARSCSATTTGSYNTSVGMLSLGDNTTGALNTSVGMSSLQYNTTGYHNIAVGAYALLQNTTGYENVAVGNEALYDMSTGSNNTAIGFKSLYTCVGSNNTAVGKFSGSNITSGSNNLTLGNNAQPSTSTVSNQITLGNSSISTLRCQVTSITSLSDARDKKNIESLPIGLEFVNSLNPVKFDWDTRDGAKVNVPDTGFIAQDLAELEDKTGISDYLKLTFRDNPDKLEASYGRLVPILVKAIQDLSAKVNELEERLNA